MVRNHSRKAEARDRRTPGQNHRQAVEAVRHDQADDVGLKTPADGHTGWECVTGASLIADAMTPGPGRLGTMHAVIYVCPGHRAAAEERITAAGYRADVRDAPPGHRWDPWPCGHVTAFRGRALAALTAAADDGLVLVVDHPEPVLDGAPPCPECAGKGVSGAWFEQPTDGGRPPLAVPSACPGCWGCGRAEHDGCMPSAHVTDDPEDDDQDDDQGDYLDELDDDQDDGAEACPSCGGRRFYVVQTAPTEDPVDGPAAALADLAAARGVSAWDVTGAAAFRELDELLGEGAQRLADQAAREAVFLLMPCGCAEDSVRTVRRSELGIPA